MTTKYLVITLYFLVLIVLGYWASKRIKGLSDFYVGGKKLGYWVVAFSTRATGESAWLLLGVTGLGAMVGYSAYWVVLGEVLGVFIAWFYMAKPFKRLTDQYDSITIPDYLHSHFNATNPSLRIIAASALTIFVVIYVSAQIDATGSAFESFLGWDYYTGAMVGFGIVMVYIFFGGFVAVAWSDVFQGLLMFFGLAVLPLYAITYTGSFQSIPAKLQSIDPGLINIWGQGDDPILTAATILGYACIGLGFMGSPQVFVRFMSIKNVSEIDKGRWVAIAFTLITDTAAVTIGILGRLIFTENGQDPIAILGNGAQNVLPLMVASLLPLIFSSLYVAVVLAAIMSTIDSLLVVASSAITRDFDQQVLNNQRANPTAFSRKVTMVLAIAALALALLVAELSPTRTIFWFVIFGWSGIAATFCPMIILTLFWKNYHMNGAIASMVVGFLCIPLFRFGASALPSAGIYFEQIAELGPSFLMSFLAGVLVSYWYNRQAIVKTNSESSSN
jgi:sodium/proline symporter